VSDGFQSVPLSLVGGVRASEPPLKPQPKPADSAGRW